MISAVEFTPRAERQFRKLPIQLERRILEKIELFIATGRPMTFARPLVNLPPATHRFRIGKYRRSHARDQIKQQFRQDENHNYGTNVGKRKDLVEAGQHHQILIPSRLFNRSHQPGT